MRKMVKIFLIYFSFLELFGCKKGNVTKINSVNPVKTCTTPTDQSSGLPLPSTLPNKEYQPLLYQFLGTRKYQTLNWQKDKTIRDTGPLVGSTYIGTHPAVRIYYSPSVIQWMEKNRANCLPDGAMIIKEMYESPASKHSGVSADQPAKLWTVMIKDQKG